MLTIIADEQRHIRKARITETLTQYTDTAPIVLDDTMTTLAGLEQYCYPSLFESTTPVIHGQFLLMGNTALFDAGLAKKIIASPTVFILEELTLPAVFITTLKKYGAVVHSGEKISRKKNEHDFFAVTAVLTAPDKKSRWLAYRAVLAEQPIEAVLGILYWKARQMNTSVSKKMYEALLDANAHAWQKGVPLELLIEKVILTV